MDKKNLKSYQVLKKNLEDSFLNSFDNYLKQAKGSINLFWLFKRFEVDYEIEKINQSIDNLKNKIKELDKLTKISKQLLPRNFNIPENTAEVQLKLKEQQSINVQLICELLESRKLQSKFHQNILQSQLTIENIFSLGMLLEWEQYQASEPPQSLRPVNAQNLGILGLQNMVEKIQKLTKSISEKNALLAEGRQNIIKALEFKDKGDDTLTSVAFTKVLKYCETLFQKH